MHAKRIKKSYGVLCVRFNRGRNEYLLVKKRYTYNFSTFVFGNYNIDSPQKIKLLLDKTTVNEKLDILHGSFALLWIKVMQQIPTPNNSLYEVYRSSEMKFNRLRSRDGGRYIADIVRSAASTDYIWDMVKGRKNTIYEHDMDAALREFTEETGISQNEITLVPDAVFRYKISAKNKVYVSYMYLAYYTGSRNPDTQLTVDMRNAHQYSEISNIAWMDMQTIACNDSLSRLHKFIKSISNQIKRRTDIIRKWQATKIEA